MTATGVPGENQATIEGAGAASSASPASAAELISEMVPPDDLPNAVTLNSVSMNIARVFEAALGGAFVAARPWGSVRSSVG